MFFKLFFFSSYRPKTCLHQCVSPSFHWSSSVSLPHGDSVMYPNSLIDLPSFVIRACSIPFLFSVPKRLCSGSHIFPVFFFWNCCSKKVPDGGWCTLKYVAHCHMTLKCCIGWCISYVCGIFITLNTFSNVVKGTLVQLQWTPGNKVLWHHKWPCRGYW
jgi:hypothetical protein